MYLLSDNNWCDTRVPLLSGCGPDGGQRNQSAEGEFQNDAGGVENISSLERHQHGELFWARPMRSLYLTRF